MCQGLWAELSRERGWGLCMGVSCAKGSLGATELTLLAGEKQTCPTPPPGMSTNPRVAKTPVKRSSCALSYCISPKWVWKRSHDSFKTFKNVLNWPSEPRRRVPAIDQEEQSTFIVTLGARYDAGRVHYGSLKVEKEMLYFWNSWAPSFNFFLNKFIYFIYLATLGLRFCARAFSSCGKWGLLFVAGCKLLITVASLVAEHGL